MVRTGTTGAVILAAGESRRFGSPKQLAMLGDRTLLEHVLELAWRIGLRPVVAVVPIWLSRPASADAGVSWVRNAHPERGLSHSLRLGLGALPPHVTGTMILLGDQPLVEEAHLRAILAARGQRPIIATLSQGLAMPPLLLERAAFALADSLSGDVGLRGLLREQGDRVTGIAPAQPTSDVDVPDDLDRLGPAGGA
jgi:CTP:molybdopterin cytidylyltransferase MocA